MTTILLDLLFSISLLTNHVTPAGTQLHVRLTSTVGSYASQAGSPISAVLIAPLTVDGEMILQAGSTLSGTVKAVTRVGWGVRHETSGLDLEFNQLALPDGESLPISARVAEVDNGRERVTRKGRIQGERATASMCYRVSGYVRTMLLWEMHAELAEWAIRSLLVELPEPELYYPAGVELTLALTRPLRWDARQDSDQQPPARLLTADERDDLSRVAEAMPYRTQAPGSGRSSDLTNVLVIGTHDQIVNAFAAAGWTEAMPPSFRDRINWIRAVGERRGHGAASMSPLLLNGAEPDMSWQKGLNDVSKRHHIRMWKEAATWRGQELWIGAATRDIDFAFLRPGRTLTHKIEENVDQERDKVAYDLAFTTCGKILDWADREDFPRLARNATGDPVVTDGRMAAIELNDCHEPRLSTETVDVAPLPEHGDRLQRFARREILTARNDLLRTNPYWRTYEGSRWLIDYYIRWHRRRSLALELSSNSPNSALAQSARLAASRMP
jgi:hypothetical protein